MPDRDGSVLSESQQVRARCPVRYLRRTRDSNPRCVKAGVTDIFFRLKIQFGHSTADGVHGPVGAFEIVQIDFVAGFFDKDRLTDFLGYGGIIRAGANQLFKIGFFS